jgi:HSP20 family protein
MNILPYHIQRMQYPEVTPEDARSEWDAWNRWLFENRMPARAYPVCIREADGRIEVEAEMPGFRKEDIHVNVEKDVLHIEAERGEENKKGKEHINERRFTRVERHLRLPAAVDPSGVKARLNDGVLYLAIPEIAPPDRKRIEIK